MLRLKMVKSCSNALSIENLQGLKNSYGGSLRSFLKRRSLRLRTVA